MAERGDGGATPYRGHRIEAVRRRRGWMLRISAVGDGPSVIAFTIRNSVPRGRDVLVAEARAWIDRKLDGPPWQGAP